MVSSTLGSPTNTFWKRRSSAASFSTYLRYSSSVVAPMQCSSPRASAGLSMLPASIEPSALPAPTIVCSSSMNRMIWPSFFARSLSTAFRRSSNSPRNFAPAISAPMSSDSTRRPRRPSGTSSLMMRCARPSTIAVLPTPGSPISTGLFLVRRCSTWMVRRISSSRPITGSSLPVSARAVRSMRVLLERLALVLGVLGSALSRRRACASMAASSFCFVAPAALSARPASPLSSSAREQEQLARDERIAALLRELVGDVEQARQVVADADVAGLAGDLGQLVERLAEALAQQRHVDAGLREQRRACCRPAGRAARRAGATGSITLWSRPTASDCASASACWKREVSLSMRMGMEPRGCVGPARGPANSVEMRAWRPDASTGPGILSAVFQARR